MNNIIETLESLGYSPLVRSGDFIRTRALYRNGNNPHSLSINIKTGAFADFAASTKGSWKDFLTLNLKDKVQVDKYLNNESEIINPQIENIIPTQIKKYDKALLNKLLPLFDFYTNRGIDISILKEFQAGLATNGPMRNRIIFPVFDHKDNSLIGFSGRLVTKENGKYPKWLIKGKKNYFCYPLHLNKQVILEKYEVILLESVGDTLALFNAGIRNCLCTFGLNISSELLKNLIILNPRKIIIALNRDENERGQDGATKIRTKLLNYFDEKTIEIRLPTKNDFGDMNIDEIKEFFNEKH
jgi:DNA primase catalytic core, N-terminal domain/Toprim-like